MERYRDPQIYVKMDSINKLGSINSDSERSITCSTSSSDTSIDNNTSRRSVPRKLSHPAVSPTVMLRLSNRGPIALDTIKNILEGCGEVTEIIQQHRNTTALVRFADAADAAVAAENLDAINVYDQSMIPSVVISSDAFAEIVAIKENIKKEHEKREVSRLMESFEGPAGSELAFHPSHPTVSLPQQLPKMLLRVKDPTVPLYDNHLFPLAKNFGVVEAVLRLDHNGVLVGYSKEEALLSALACLNNISYGGSKLMTSVSYTACNYVEMMEQLQDDGELQQSDEVLEGMSCTGLHPEVQLQQVQQPDELQEETSAVDVLHELEQLEQQLQQVQPVAEEVVGQPQQPLIEVKEELSERATVSEIMQQLQQLRPIRQGLQQLQQTEYEDVQPVQQLQLEENIEEEDLDNTQSKDAADCSAASDI